MKSFFKDNTFKMIRLETKRLNFKPIEIEFKPISGFSLRLMGSRVLPDAGHQPQPTPEKIREYNQHGKHWVHDIVFHSMRTHPTDVLHGSQSLKLLLPHFSRQPKDFDIFSFTERKRALALEEAIDKKSGCNIAETRYTKIPNITGRDDPTASRNLYQVITKPTNDSDIDVMDRPKKLSTVSKNGITHESLISQYHRAKQRRILQPIKSFKASSDMRDIERYWRGKKLIDTDRDKVPDAFDFAPNDPTRQGLLYSIKQRYQKTKELKPQRKQYIKEQTKTQYGLGAERKIFLDKQRQAEYIRYGLRGAPSEYRPPISYRLSYPPQNFHLSKDVVTDRSELIRRMEEQRIQDLMKQNVTTVEAQDIAESELRPDFDKYAYGMTGAILWKRYQPILKEMCFAPYYKVEEYKYE